MTIRRTMRITRAVERAMLWGGSGHFWNQEFSRSAKGRAIESAHIRNAISEESSDQREGRNASLALRLYGSFAAAARSRAIIEAE